MMRRIPYWDITKYIECLSSFNVLLEWADENAPYCKGAISETLLFFCTKTCEEMIYNYHDKEFLEIQEYVLDNKDSIDSCGLRIRMLSKAILRSWGSYRFLGSSILYMKKLYLALSRLKG